MTDDSTNAGYAGPKRYKKRQYGQSCYSCRERKIKCEGIESPPCKMCRETNTLCEAVDRTRKKPKPHSAADFGALATDFERRLRRLEALNNCQDATSPSVGRQYSVTDRSPETIVEQPAEDGLGRPQYHLGTAAKPVYHGELSMFDDSGERISAASSPRLTETESPQVWTDERLQAAARLRHRYATTEEGETWMNAYFSWASPVYAVVHRPTFIRDMALDGPYFSEFLLIIIYITGIRLTYGMNEREREARGEQYVSLAMGMLAEETMGQPRIPTIQALLGFAGRQSATGKTNQAWMLTGMAIRMMQDMGLHLPVNEDALSTNFSEEDNHMRRRLFWSAYCWDKTMSLTLGREPGLPCRPGFTPELPPDPEDDVDWQPQLQPGQTLPLGRPYPKTRLLKSFALCHSSRLNVILESILTNMYSPGSPNTRSVSFIAAAVDRLNTWRKELPAELKIEAPMLPAVSPPSNVVILNLLYHTIRILIFRPLLTSNSRSTLASSALNHCRNAAAGTHDLLSLWGRTFGHFSHHYLFLYCCFISAGVDILVIRAGSPFVRDEALQRVHLSLDILEQASSQGPGIRRGIVSIRKQLDKVLKGDVTTSRDPPAPAIQQDAASTVPMDPLAMEFVSTQQGAALSFQLPTDLDGFTGSDLWDHQMLLDLLGAAPISTEDPFSFN